MTREEIITAQTALNMAEAAIEKAIKSAWDAQDDVLHQRLMDERKENRAQFRILADQRVAI